MEQLNIYLTNAGLNGLNSLVSPCVEGKGESQKNKEPQIFIEIKILFSLKKT